MAEIEYPGIAKLVSRLVWDQETVRSSRTTRAKIPLKSLISEGFFLSLITAAQNLSLSFLTYLFDSSCAKCETIIQVIRLSSIFSCMRTPSSRLSNFTFRTESADQICRQACLIYYIMILYNAITTVTQLPCALRKESVYTKVQREGEQI